MSEFSQTEVAGGQIAKAPPLALINARLVDPKSGRDESGGLLIEHGLIVDFGGHLRRNAPAGSKIVDCGGDMLCPGLVDMMVFAGEPGYRHRESLKSAGMAAAAGGVTTLICMPNTRPVIDDVSLVDFIKRRAHDTGFAHVHPMAALTKGLKGLELSEIGLLRDAGAVAFTNGYSSVMNAQVMRRILAYARDFDALIVHYTEDRELAGDGVMNEGEVSSRLGLPGIPAIAETIMLERDLRLVEVTGGRYHAALLSHAGSLAIMADAKARGLPVSCGVSVNHLAHNENDIGPYRSFFKLKPPLRTEDDRQALIAGVKSGLIDVVVSAHDPKDADVKRHPFAEAADGAIGVETLLPALLRHYHNGELSLPELLRPVTCNPAALLGLKTGEIAKGVPADLSRVNLDTPWSVDPNDLHSKSKNTPFDNQQLQGRVVETYVMGRRVFPFC